MPSTHKAAKDYTCSKCQATIKRVNSMSSMLVIHASVVGQSSAVLNRNAIFVQVRPLQASFQLYMQRKNL